VGTVCGAPRCTPGSAPHSSSSASLSRRSAAADVAQLGDPRAVVGELCEEATRSSSASWPSTGPAAGGPGRPRAGRRRADLPSRAERRVGARRGPGGETRPRSRAHRAPPTELGSETDLMSATVVLPNGSMCSRRSLLRTYSPVRAGPPAAGTLPGVRTAQQGCTSTGRTGAPASARPGDVCRWS
jgi:hypothetical protein